MSKLKNNKLFYIFIITALITALMVSIGRMHVENENKTVDFILDYTEIAKLAKQNNDDVSVWLNHFKEMGINKAGLPEESLDYIIKEGKPLEAKLMKDVVKDIHWKEEVPEDITQAIESIYDQHDILVTTSSKELYEFVKEGFLNRYDETRFIFSEGTNEYFVFINGNVKDTLYTQKYKLEQTSEKGFVELREPVYSKLMYLSLGLDQEKVDIIQQSGMTVIPKTVGYDGWNGKKFEKATIKEYKALNEVPEYYLGAGYEIVGQDDESEMFKQYIKDNNIVIGMVESTFQRGHNEQAGILDLVKETEYHTVRTFTTWPYIQNRYEYYDYKGSEEIENTFFRAITERNIRLIYFKPFKEFKDNFVYITDVDEYKRMFESLEDRIAEHGMTIGPASVMNTYEPSKLQKIWITIGTVAAGMILLSGFVQIKEKYLYGLFTIISAGVFGAFTVNMKLAELVASLGAAIIFPSLGILYLLKRCRAYSNISEDENILKIIGFGMRELMITSFISLAGALFTSSVIADINFFLELDIFRGVKIAQLIPLIIFALLYLSYIGFNREHKQSIKFEIKDIKDILMANIQVWVVLVGIVVLAAGYIYIARTGHETSIEPLGIEMILRNFLEENFLARPRTKEFLIAFPALMLLIYTFVKRFRWLPFLFGLAAVIGQTSIVNTFMHMRTPIYMSLIRTAYSLLFGVVLGIIYIIVFDLLIKIFRKIRGEI